MSDKIRKTSCEICNIKTWRADGQKRVFMAKFPLDAERCKQWVAATGKEDLVYVPIEKLHQLKYICGRHFRPRDFSRSKFFLKKRAVPCIDIHKNPLPDHMFKNFPLHIAKREESVCALIDHNYYGNPEQFKQSDLKKQILEIKSTLTTNQTDLKQEPAELTYTKNKIGIKQEPVELKSTKSKTDIKQETVKSTSSNTKSDIKHERFKLKSTKSKTGIKKKQAKLASGKTKIDTKKKLAKLKSAKTKKKNLTRSEDQSEIEIISPDKPLFSWQTENENMIPQDESQHLDNVIPDNQSMYDGYHEALTMTVQEEIGSNVNGCHVGFQCDNCNGDIVGFRYSCVQCTNLDLCISCEYSGVHNQHYMLRIPGPKPYNEIQKVVMKIRRYLMKESDPISTIVNNDDDDVLSVKSEIKSENGDVEVEQVNLMYKDINIINENDSTISTLGTLTMDNVDYKLLLAEEIKPVEEHVIISKQEINENQSPVLVRTLTDNIVSSNGSNSANKRKLIMKMSDFMRIKQANKTIKNICVLPTTNTVHTNNTGTMSNHIQHEIESAVIVSNQPNDLVNQEQIDTNGQLQDIVNNMEMMHDEESHDNIKVLQFTQTPHY